ncbi:MAG: peptidylprolyl isomerase [Sulfurimonadaceae bacterium]|jgi:parvulin-like peptidyl-prolyl isomerase|nr:peptidylprolyl isomerase [Sulfurimonadaceae bacterium]
MVKIVKIVTASLILTCTLATAQTLVTVNGTAITQSDVDNALMQATQGRFNQVPADKQAEFRRQVLEQLIAKELIFDDAKKNGILESKEYKDEYEIVLENVKKELAIQVWQQKELEKVEVSEKELKSYYDKNKEEFVENEKVKASHILVKTEDEANKITAELQSLKGVALENKFAEIAKEKSTCTSAPRGGDLGYFYPGQMVPEFNDKAFSMSAKTITQKPVKTVHGYHVIYLADKQIASTKSFKEVKPFLEQRLKMEKFKTTMQTRMQVLEKKAIIK